MRDTWTRRLTTIVIATSAVVFWTYKAETSTASSVTNSIGMKLIRIQPGTFTMGEVNATPPSLKGPQFTDQGNWDEQPVHKVTISKEFFISETPVTIEQYRQFQREYRGLE